MASDCIPRVILRNRGQRLRNWRIWEPLRPSIRVHLITHLPLASSNAMSNIWRPGVLLPDSVNLGKRICSPSQCFYSLSSTSSPRFPYNVIRWSKNRFFARTRLPEWRNRKSKAKTVRNVEYRREAAYNHEQSQIGSRTKLTFGWRRTVIRVLYWSLAHDGDTHER